MKEDLAAETELFFSARPAHRRLILDLLKVLEEAPLLGKLLVEEAVREIIERGKEFR